jgi:hypothetical protein
MENCAAKHSAEHSARTKRLLIPVAASERSRWGVRYALRQQGSGQSVRVVLLFVADPVSAAKSCAFVRTSRGPAPRPRAARKSCTTQRSHWSRQAFSCQEVYREGDIVAQIGDVAEQLDCDAIVLPRPHARITKLLARDVVREVLKRGGKGVPVVTTDSRGLAEPDSDGGR